MSFRSQGPVTGLTGESRVPSSGLASEFSFRGVKNRAVVCQKLNNRRGVSKRTLDRPVVEVISDRYCLHVAQLR